jgi:hypothetical protein
MQMFEDIVGSVNSKAKNTIFFISSIPSSIFWKCFLNYFILFAN